MKTYKQNSRKDLCVPQLIGLLQQDVAMLQTEVKQQRKRSMALTVAFILLATFAGCWALSRPTGSCETKEHSHPPRKVMVENSAESDDDLHQRHYGYSPGGDMHKGRVPSDNVGEIARGIDDGQKPLMTFDNLQGQRRSEQLARDSAPMSNNRGAITQYDVSKSSRSNKVSSRLKRSTDCSCKRTSELAGWKRCCKAARSTAQYSQEITTDVYNGNFSNFFGEDDYRILRKKRFDWVPNQHRQNAAYIVAKKWPGHPIVDQDLLLWIKHRETPLGCFDAGPSSCCSLFDSSTGVFRVAADGVYLVHVRLTFNDTSKNHWAAVTVDDCVELSCHDGGSRSHNHARKDDDFRRVCQMSGVLNLNTTNRVSVKTMSDDMGIFIWDRARMQPIFTITRLSKI